MIQPSEPNQGDTRHRLLQTALAVFGHRDFGAVSVREIVEQAEANIAAVSYHFGGKQGLYLATAAFLAEQLQQRLGPLLTGIQTAVQTADKVQAGALLERLIRGLTTTLLLDRLGDDAAGFILREQHQPTAAFDILYDRLMLPIQQTFQLLVARVLGDGNADPRRLTLITHALIGQIIAFRMARTTVLRRLGQHDFSAADVDDIVVLVGRLTLNALHEDNIRSPST